MTCMPDEIVLARVMTTLDLEFEKAMHYNDEGYESDDYGLLPQVMMPVCIFSVFTTEDSFTPAEYKENTTQYLTLHTQMTQKLAIP